MSATEITFREKLRAAPLLRALVPMATGVAAGTFVAVPLYVWTVCAVVCAATGWLAIARRESFAALYAGLAVLFFGAATARAHTPKQIVPRGERVWMEAVITDNPTYRQERRSASTYGTITRWQPDGSVSSEGWHTAGERMLVGFDTMWHFGVGDRVVFRGYVNPVAADTTSYGRLMRARGYTGRTHISQYSRPEVAHKTTSGPAEWAKKLQSGASKRLRQLESTHAGLPDSDATAVATAMTTGDRTGITTELRQAYSRTGASHLLAVSGLHVGIVFLIVNILLYLLPLFPRGHIVKNVAAVAAIWFYAMLTGLSPSATRAAFMFTGAQIALATSRTRGPANIMCGTAIVMLAVRPGLLFDISFQLSFLAVAAIMSWFLPIYRLVESRLRLLNALWGTLVIGLVATVATLPLVSHTFGVFSLAGIALNPLIFITSHLIIAFSLIWIAIPLPMLEPCFGWLVGGPAWLQNRVVEAVSNVPGAAIEWSMPTWCVVAVYAGMATLTVWYYAKPHRREPFVLPR